MRTSLVPLLIVGLASLAGTTVARPLGTAFTYQGSLADGGTPANGCYDLRFTLYDALTNGAVISSVVTNTATPVTNGRFMVTLDFGASPFNGVARWLETGVRINGSVAEFTTLSPRQPLTPSPYSLYAPNAETAARVSGSVSTAQLTGTISGNNIGAGSITAVMLAAGAVGSNQLASGAVSTGALADGAVTRAKMATAASWSSLTIAGPTPTPGEGLGYSLAAVGTDRVLIGAPFDDTGATYTGVAYLFTANGTLLTTFTNPTPAEYDNFGASVAAVGTDRVLIGAYRDNTGATDAGAAYLFSTNGALLNTFTNPNPTVSDNFGWSLAAVGTDRVLIGAPYEDWGAADAGAAYLFGTNGTLLATFANPTPGAGDFFGYSVAAVGTDRVLIGVPYDDTGATDVGAVYLFHINGTLLTTFTNPTPVIGDAFGWSVAAVGADRVLIGAIGDDTGAVNAGAAYLFNSNGKLLTTFTNPTPATGDFFGHAVAAVGADRVLIAARYDDTGATDAGAAYLLGTNGALLAAFTNPTPAVGEWFGYSVAALGSDRVLIGAVGDKLGATDAGAVYLFSLETYTPGLVTGGVSARSITTASLEDGAVTRAKLDPAIGVWTRSGNNVFRLSGNVGIGTNVPNQKLVVAGNIHATGTITPNSDRNAKTAFAPVDTAAVLAEVARLPIQQWRFQAEAAGVKHMGPMAQDFRAAFGLGESPTAIATVDADGVALAAIQGLNRKLEAENTALEYELAELKALVKSLAQKVNGGAQ